MIKKGPGLLALLLAAATLLSGGFAAATPIQKKAPRQSKKEVKKPEPAPAEVPVLETPRQMLDKARSAATAGERIEKLEALLAASLEEPFNAEARQSLMREYALRGEQHLREGAPQLALQDFKALFKATPADMSERVFSQFIFPLPMAMNAFGYRSESVDLMRSFEPRFENDLNRLVQIGFFYVQIEAPLEAIRVLERAVQLGPNDHRAHNSLGTAYLINLRLEDAATEFDRALQLNPKDEFANLNLANVARAFGDYEKALNHYRKQLEIKQDDGEAHGGMSIVLLALGRDAEADRAIKRALEIAPQDYRFMTQLAYFYAARKKPALARPYIERAIRIDPRYAWAHITKANIDMLEGKHGDALATVLQAQTLATFPTLGFEVIKMLMALDGYDQAMEFLSKSFDMGENGEFETVLGGVAKARSPRLDALLERERRASLLLHENPTTAPQYRLAEALAQIQYFSEKAIAGRRPPVKETPRGRRGAAQPASGADDLKGATRPRRASGAPATTELSAGKDANLPGMPDLLRALTAFVSLDDGRQAFRMVWAARKLTEWGIALDASEQLARQAIAMAESATGPNGSMRDAPLLDREGRRRVFLGRAHDALGWTLFKKGNTQNAIEHLQLAVEQYPPSAERTAALWHLAVATEEGGDAKRALDLYIASYEPETPTAAVRRNRIEALYKKLNGSLAGLDQKLKR